MLEDAALFKYELAIVAILKNEAPYIKEWIDYHLLAGVDHFYLYDNESEDNLKEILQPYIENDIVTYKFYPGKGLQLLAYNEAVKDYKFDCQYMAFIDADEFIYPRENKTILEVLDEILSSNPNAAGLAVNWHIFGSSGQEKADFTKGVLERFVYRTKDDFCHNDHVKTIANPRHISVVTNPHFLLYFDSKFAINENGNYVPMHTNKPCTTLKIGINHYFTKSKEEFIKKRNRGKADLSDLRDMSEFDIHDQNDIYDDGILKYKAIRQELENTREGGIKSAQQINQRRFNALLGTLSPLILSANLSLFDDENGIFSGKIHLFLICWAVSRDLKTAGLSEKDLNFLEELSLKYLYKSLLAGSVEIWQLQLLIDELPKILACDYPVVGDIKEMVKNFVPPLMNIKRTQNYWQGYKQLDYILEMLNIDLHKLSEVQ